MARVNITVPDELIARARDAGLNVSGVTAEALADELDRQEKIQGLRDYLAELDAELGPPSEEELRAAREWADAAFPEPPPPGLTRVTTVFDSGALSSFAAQRTTLGELVDRGLWPAQVPAVVLAESLTGDHRHDFHINRLLQLCQVRDVSELCARDAARMRTATGRAGTISAVDAVVVAHAAAQRTPIVLTSDPGDLGDLAAHASRPVTVVSV